MRRRRLRQHSSPADPLFDIFAGVYGKDAKWIESVNGLGYAHIRMEELAAQAPGKYFIFSSYSRSVLAQIDTSGPPALRRGVSAKKQSA